MIHNNFTVITCVPSLTGTQLAKTLSICIHKKPLVSEPLHQRGKVRTVKARLSASHAQGRQRLCQVHLKSATQHYRDSKKELHTGLTYSGHKRRKHMRDHANNKGIIFKQ